MENNTLSANQEKVTTSVENVLEFPQHLDVSKLMEEKNAFFVHMIQVVNNFDVSITNKSLDTKKLSVGDKLDLLYGVSPTLSASTVRPLTKDKTFNGGFGVIFSHGEIAHAHQGDAATRALSLTERDVLTGVKKEKEDVDKAIDKETAEYNEFVLKGPEVAGGFMKLTDDILKRVRYEEEEMEYYNGERRITKVGVIDMKNSRDMVFDTPFSVLLEMKKRGNVFVMDQANHMYTIQSIDEKNRTVEFVASPITPKDFSFSYGSEKMNPYHKKEMKERLEGSLQDKGMTLH